MTYLVIGIQNADRYGVDYTSPFLDDYAVAFANAETMCASLGMDAVVSIIKNPFTDDAISQTLTKADFEGKEVFITLEASQDFSETLQEFNNLVANAIHKSAT